MAQIIKFPKKIKEPEFNAKGLSEKEIQRIRIKINLEKINRMWNEIKDGNNK